MRPAVHVVPGSSGMDVRREHDHEESDQSEPGSPRQSRHQKADRAGKLCEPGQGDEEIGARELRGYHPNEVGPRLREMREARENKHDRQARPRGCRPTRKGANPKSAGRTGAENRGDHDIENNQ
jgi:hypothetical protein